jgi:hypothetical protein
MNPANLNRREQEAAIRCAWERRCAEMRRHGQINNRRELEKVSASEQADGGAAR